jgi:hypothetical protein
LRSKIKVINTKLEAKAKNRVRKDNKELMQTMDSLHRIFRGVIEYNENY